MSDYEIINGVAINRKNQTKIVHKEISWVENLNGLCVHGAIEYLNTLEQNDILQCEEPVHSYVSEIVKLSIEDIKSVDIKIIELQIKSTQNEINKLSKEIVEMKSDPKSFDSDKANEYQFIIAKLKYHECRIQKMKVDLKELNG